MYKLYYLLFIMQTLCIQGMYVRVLLNESVSPSWTFCCIGGFRIINKKTQHQTIINNSIVTVKRIGNKFVINNHYSCSQPMILHPLVIGNKITFNQQAYEGFFTFQRSDKNFYCINTIGLENYIYSVLQSESWPGWPLEVNMALAISCRSYVVARIAQRSKKRCLYDICNTNKHQTYKGYHTNEQLRQPVNRTKGIIITHNNKPITAMFDSCCGSVITGLMEGTDFIKFPYLKRTKACTHCQSAKIFEWHAEISLAHFEETLRKKGFKCSKVTKVAITKKDKAGIVQEITLHSSKGITHITGKQLYGMFKQIKSYVYTIEKNRNNLKIHGYGYGHHLGLCQWGARSMVDKGYNHKDIIKFYYPTTELRRIA